MNQLINSKEFRAAVKCSGIQEEIRAVLDRKRMTTADLAQRMGVPEMQVNFWLQGRHDFSLSTISWIEEALESGLLFTVEYVADALIKFEEAQDEIERDIHLGPKDSGAI